MPEASASDVRVEIDTHLDDSDIEGADGDGGLLARIAREIDRAYDDDLEVVFADVQHRQDFEAVLTALRIAEGKDRRGESVQSGRTSTTYEASEIENLRKRVRRADPGDEFGHAGSVVRDTDRHVSTTTDS